MRFYRKKPVVIEAVHYMPDTLDAVAAFVGDSFLNDMHGVGIATLEGRMTISEGDWVIRGVKGEFYPCKPDIFDATYEEAADAPKI